LRNEGYNVKSTNLHIDESIPPKDVLDLLRLPEGSSVYRIQRIITADNRPIAIATNYIIQGFVPNLINFQNNIQSLYTFIEQHYEVALSNATDYITARSANIEQSNILHIPLNSPLIYLRRFVYTKGTPLTCDDMLIDASRYKFSVNLVGRPPSSALKK
jgi:GntR family transcriptional regulator